METSDPELVVAHLAAGGRVIRHFHVMSHSLAHLPDIDCPATLAIAPLGAEEVLAHADELGRMNYRAYPASHPDHESMTPVGAVNYVRDTALGLVTGNFVDLSTVGRVDGTLVGACFVTDRRDDRWDGPWITDVFRDPDVPVKGVGRALIASSVARCQADERTNLGLAVTDANETARALYRSLGFAQVSENWRLAGL